MDSLEKPKLSNSILRTIRKMNEYAEKQVLPQIQNNKNFPKSISQYIM